MEKKDTKVRYAMKVLEKKRVMGQNIVRYALTERNVLSLVEHPFIVRLNFAFQTKKKLFLILDYCPCGDLGDLLDRKKRLPEQVARMYASEVLLALEELHRRDIIYRDLKPDNLVIDSEGHISLTDFGLSKEGIEGDVQAQSFCGSIAYLAPEMVQRKGHGKSVDWYLFGVLIFEMLVGIPPFYSKKKDELFRNIVSQELKVPFYMSHEVEDLLRKLLDREPSKRIGAGSEDAEEIKRHPWFAGVDWEAVYARKLKVPREKEVKKEEDGFEVSMQSELL